MTNPVNGFQDLPAPLAALVLDYCHEEPTVNMREVVLRDVNRDRNTVYVVLRFHWDKIAAIFEKAVVDVPVVDYFSRLSRASLKLPALRAFAVTTFVYNETIPNVAGDTHFRLNFSAWVKEAVTKSQSGLYRSFRNPQAEPFALELRIDACFKVLGIEANPKQPAPEKEISASDMTSESHDLEVESYWG